MEIWKDGKQYRIGVYIYIYISEEGRLRLSLQNWLQELEFSQPNSSFWVIFTNSVNILHFLVIYN